MQKQHKALPYPTYDTYKDSGVDWLGEIPEKWEIRRLASFGRFSKGGGFSKSDLKKKGVKAVLYGDIYTKYNFVIQNAVRFISIETAKKSVEIQKGDLLFTGSGETKEDIGKCVTFEGVDKTFAGGDVIIFRPNQFHSKFLSYVLNSDKVNAEKSKTAKGEIIVHTYASKLKNLKIPIPPKSEQTAIANFLDEKCAKIKQAIAQKERLINVLQERKQIVIQNAVTKGLNPDVSMKDSGVAWIGEIPKHWQVKRLKTIIKALESGTSVNASESEQANSNEIGVLKTSSVYSYKFVSKQNKKVFATDLRKISCPVKKDRIIISRMNAPELVGASGYVEKDHPNLFLPDRLWQTVFHEPDLIHAYWLSQSFICLGFRSKITSLSIGSSPSMKNISKGDFLNIKICIPPKLEQINIANFIKQKTTKIDTAIKLQRAQIAELQAYQRSLIDSAVRGRIKLV